ncbi:DUF4190 domain-containing protein [Rhodococcoides fascians]|uniref:DUF4190 domain-containing protein n=1 Tax=Rhodococcoides fascians TaxID=1828 RepID=UPI000AD7D615|nr:DUF4190 domain-containing protein [Rhodococcus fascians]NIL86204.1 hypothetical protein [Rhodococcus fascians]
MSNDYPPPGNYPSPGEYPQQGGYQQGGYEQQPVAPKNTIGTVALVLAILGVLFSWTIVGGVVLGLIAIVLGFIGRSRYKKRVATNGTVSLIAIILGFVAAALSIVLVVVGVGLFNAVGGQDFTDCMTNAGSDTAAQQQCADEFKQNVENQYDDSTPN